MHVYKLNIELRWRRAGCFLRCSAACHGAQGGGAAGELAHDVPLGVWQPVPVHWALMTQHKQSGSFLSVGNNVQLSLQALSFRFSEPCSLALRDLYRILVLLKWGESSTKCTAQAREAPGKLREIVSLLSCVWLFCNPMDCSPPWTVGSTVHGISQAGILGWVAMSFSRGSSWPRDQTCISYNGRQILYWWATWEAPEILAWWIFQISLKCMDLTFSLTFSAKKS